MSKQPKEYCKKCGNIGASYRYVADISETFVQKIIENEKLLLTCNRCSYEWEIEVLEKESKKDCKC